jgi:hypothetical protein
VLLQVVRKISDGHAVDPRTSFVRFDSLVGLPAVFPFADFFYQLLVTSWTFGCAFRRARFGPFLKSLGASLLPSSVKASTSWFFCRLSLIESCALLAAPYCLGLIACATNTPAADFCCTVRVDRSTLSRDSVTCNRPPEVSSIAFHAQPPDLPPVPLMDVGFAIIGSLARHRRPQIQFLSIGSRVCSTLLSDFASRLSPRVSLSLLLHQDG